MKPVLLALTTLMLSALAGGAAGNCVTDTSQANFQAGVANNVDLTTSSGNVLLTNNTGGTVDQKNLSISCTGPGMGCYGTPFDTTSWVGQTFTAGVSGHLGEVDVNLICASCLESPPPIVVSIRATSGGLPTGTDLAVTTIPGINPVGGYQPYYHAVFGTPATLSAGTKYAILIRLSAPFPPLYDQSGKPLFPGQIAVTRSGTSVAGNDVYSGGALIDSFNSGSSWNVESDFGLTADIGFITYMGAGGGYSPSGDLISSLKDATPATGETPSWTTLTWTNTVPTGTSIRFQAAASNSSTGPFAFVGPDGTAVSFFTTSGASLAQFNGNRYLKYRAFLTTSSSTATPILSDATTCSVNAGSTDLSITNSDGATTATPGTTVTYTITAANAAGGSTATNAIVADTFQAPLSNCSYTCSSTNGGTCPSSGIGNINASVTLPGGSSVVFVEKCSLAGSATGSLSNTATVTPPANILDPTTGNNSATDTDTLTPTADLSITNSDSLTGTNPGNTVTYAIRAANAGPSAATGVHVVDQFPSTLTCNWTCSGASNGTCGAASGSGSISDSAVNLPKGGSVTYTATCALSPAATGTLSNTATVTAPAGVTDPTTSNNSATDSDTLTVRADSAVTMVDGITSAQVGDVINYVIKVTNAGPSNDSVTVNDSLPAQLSNGSWVCSATGGASCAKASGNNNTMNTSATVPVGGIVTYVYTATLMSDNSVDTFTNVVSIAGADPNSSNNSVRDINTIVVYESDFEADQALALNVASAGGGGSAFTVQMGVDANLLNGLGSMPVTVASGRSADGKNVFSVQLVRLGDEIAMRTVTRTADGASDVSPWQTGDLKQHVLSLAWQSAAAGASDGRLTVSAGNSRMAAAARNTKDSVTQLQIAVKNNIPWLVPIAP